MPVNYLHSEYRDNKLDWDLLRDTFQGSRRIKDRGQTYLPKPLGKDDPAYLRYVERAIYFNAVRKTVIGVNGTIFRKPAQIELPPSLDYMFDDADGYGTPIDQLAKKTTEETLLCGRAGLLTDFPSMPAGINRAEEISLNARPIINVYEAEEITNWRYEKINGVNKLSLVVLQELVSEYGEDQFTSEEVLQYRVLELDETGLYKATIWAGDGKQMAPTEVFEPRGPDGARMDFIPFQFIGANDLTADVDPSPMLDIANLAVAHYRNSADFEEALFITGQPTPIITGLSEKYIEEYSGSLIIGSRAAWLLPKEADAKLLEVQRDLQVLDGAMKRKEGQMVAVGAKLFEPIRSGVETAEAIRLRQTNESSVISAIAMNVSRAYQIALEWAAEWVGETNPDTISFALNTDFFAKRLDPQELIALVQSWQSGAITSRDLFNNLVTGEIIISDKDYEQHVAELEDEPPLLKRTGEDILGDEDEDVFDENIDDTEAKVRVNV